MMTSVRGVGFTLGLLIFGWAGGAGSAAASPAQDQYGDVQTFIHQLAQAHPANVKLFTLGTSDNGGPIEGLQIGDGAVHNLVVSTHHGNEYGATEVAKAFAAELAERPIAGQTLYVIPVLNVGGYNIRNRLEYARGNAYDPNRDYPGPCGTEGPFNLKSTAALARFVDEKGIVASATLHTFYPAVLYPWGFDAKDLNTPYTDLFTQLAKAATLESGYTVGNSTDVMYPAQGTYEDYAFWKHGIWSLLFELGRTHKPADTEVEDLNRVNVPGLRRMFEQAPRLRAANHDFSGKCNSLIRMLDRHEE